MMTHPLTIDLPETVYQYLQEVALFTREPLEQLIQQSIAGNLPPRLSAAPLELQPELLRMQRLSNPQLRALAESEVSPQERQRHFVLLDKNTSNALTPAEQRELEDLRKAADQLMVRKAYAWALLRWRGVALPNLDELPVD